MIIEVDGNDGVGKTTYIKELSKLFPNDIFFDRGFLSKATLSDEFNKREPNFKAICGFKTNVCYILLDCDIKVCQERILMRGDSIDVEFHNIDDLTKYQNRFHALSEAFNVPIFDTSLNIEKNIKEIANYINNFKQTVTNQMKVVVGTSNKGKIREIASILSPLGIELIPQALDIDENGKTIEENAEIKARGYCEANEGEIVICEDSGLIVPQLNGLPGAFSSRFHSVELDKDLNVINVPREDFTTDKTRHDKLNNERLLELIKTVPFDKRTAYFEVCFIVMRNNEILFKVTRQSHGFISDELKGENGFGYDPLFIGNDTFGKTYAELDSSRKNMKSHRKSALVEVGKWFAEFLKK